MPPMCARNNVIQVRSVDRPDNNLNTAHFGRYVGYALQHLQKIGVYDLFGARRVQEKKARVTTETAISGDFHGSKCRRNFHS